MSAYKTRMIIFNNSSFKMVQTKITTNHCKLTVNEVTTIAPGKQGKIQFTDDQAFWGSEGTANYDVSGKSSTSNTIKDAKFNFHGSCGYNQDNLVGYGTGGTKELKVVYYASNYDGFLYPDSSAANSATKNGYPKRGHPFSILYVLTDEDMFKDGPDPDSHYLPPLGM